MASQEGLRNRALGATDPGTKWSRRALRGCDHGESQSNATCRQPTSQLVEGSDRCSCVPFQSHAEGGPRLENTIRNLLLACKNPRNSRPSQQEATHCPSQSVWLSGGRNDARCPAEEATEMEARLTRTHRLPRWLRLHKHLPGLDPTQRHRHLHEGRALRRKDILRRKDRTQNPNRRA